MENNVKNFLKEVSLLAEKYRVSVFAVSDGHSITRNNGNEFVRKHREYQILLENEIGNDPNEDWG